MKKLKLIMSSLCIAAVLAMAMPSAVYASDDPPQGGVKSTKDAPPPPPPPTSGGGGVLGILLAVFLG